jgi:putative CocE/NonD family hydrolase
VNDGVETNENQWIGLDDGCRLAARAWLPANAIEQPVPAILEFLPYRKRDFTRARDEPIHRYFAQCGYASIRVDLRGSGDSEGLLLDEYSEQEHSDGVEVIAWLARQGWCSGDVGMFGISWGGFNSLQIAARRPPALKAIMSLCAADDRYADDAHYMGGCLLTENLQWGAIFMQNQALPPDPEIVGASWREQWRQRLENLPNFPELWMRHPWRDDYWSAGSVRDHIERITVPVYAIGGWADGYSNAVPRLLQTLKSPCKGLVGPWAHTFPHNGIPGPAIGFLQEAVRWWDRWLKGQMNGIDDEPVLRVWMQESVKPEPQYAEMPGRWIAEPTWPSPQIETRVLYLTSGGLESTADDPYQCVVSSPQTCGIRGGEWCAFGSDGEMPRDQRPDDGFSLTFDTRRLKERTEILGAPVLRLDLSADQPVGNVIVRLCDVAPDGSSLRVTYGILNLAHRDGHASPSAMQAGESYGVTVVLNDIAHAFPAGHRIRVALSTAYWPVIWPSAAKVILKMTTCSSQLELPVRRPRPEDDDLPLFEEPDRAAAANVNKLRPHRFRRRLLSDLTSNVLRYELDGTEFDDASVVHLEDIDLTVGYTMNKRFEIQEDDPLSAVESIEQRSLLQRGPWKVVLQTTMTLTADQDNFKLCGRLQADEGDEIFVVRDWDVTVPRMLV